MKVDVKTFYDLSIELKTIVKDFMAQPHDQRKLVEFLNRFGQEGADILLAQFDRYGQNIEFEKTGLRLVDNKVQVFKFGYTDTDTVDKVCNGNKNSVEYHVIMKNFNTKLKGTIWPSAITYPPTKKMIEVFRIVLGKTIFNTSFGEMSIYAKVKKLKPTIDHISENGFTDKAIAILQEVFAGESTKVVDLILKMFDSRNPEVNFVGIRSLMHNDQLTFISIAKNGKQCEFKYNILSLRKTVDIVNRWKELKENEAHPKTNY